jgi:hypothetical protein
MIRRAINQNTARVGLTVSFLTWHRTSDAWE